MIPTVPTKVSDLTDSANYYKITETSSKNELSTEFAKYTKTEDLHIPTKVSDLTDSATYVTETELEAVSGEITALIPTNYVTSGNYISGNSQYALTSGGWTKVQTGSTLTPGSGIDIVSNEINVKLGDNLKFTDSNNTTITTIDNISSKSFNAINTENIYSKIDSRGFHHYDKNSVGTTDVSLSLTNGGLEDTLTDSTRNISANYTLNHLFFKSSAANAYSQIEMKVFADNEHKSQIILTDFDGSATNTGLIDVDRIAAWDAAAGGSFSGVTTDDTLTGIGTDASHKLGVAWSVLSGNTINSAKSAGSAEYITNGVGYSGFNDISSKFDSLTSYVPYSATELPIGTNNTATTNAAAIGGANSAIDLSFALGNGNSAKTTGCAIGEHNYAYNKSVAIGYQNTADYNVDIAIGYQCSSHDHAATFMDCNTAKNYSFAAGHANTAENYSFLLGRGLKFSGDISNGNGTALGSFVVGGWNNTTAGNALFVVGNGSSPSNKSDAFIVYRNGAVSEGTTTSAQGANSHAEGINTSAYGGQSHAEGNATYCLGNASHTEGMWSYTSGQGDHAEGVATTAVGYGIHAQGCWTEFSSTMGDAPADSTGDAGSRQVGVFVGGICNATTSHDYGEATAHNGVLAVFGNGIRRNSNSYVKSDAFVLYRDGTVSAKQFQNADGTETINGTTYNFSGVDNIEILPLAATANTANFPNDNVLRFILES